MDSEYNRHEKSVIKEKRHQGNLRGQIIDGKGNVEDEISLIEINMHQEYEVRKDKTTEKEGTTEHEKQKVGEGKVAWKVKETTAEEKQTQRQSETTWFFATTGFRKRAFEPMTDSQKILFGMLFLILMAIIVMFVRWHVQDKKAMIAREQAANGVGNSGDVHFVGDRDSTEDDATGSIFGKSNADDTAAEASTADSISGAGYNTVITKQNQYKLDPPPKTRPKSKDDTVSKSKEDAISKTISKSKEDKKEVTPRYYISTTHYANPATTLNYGAVSPMRASAFTKKRPQETV